MNRPDFSDPTQLVAAFRTGDKAAWDALYAQTAPRLLAWARSLTGCQTDAEDLTQETYLAAYLGADHFNGKSRLLTWLFGIAFRKHRDKSRSKRPPFLPLCDEIVPPHADLASDALLPLAYRQAVSDLPDTLREAFVLVAGHGFTHKEAAHILRVPEGTVKGRVVQATRKLRAALIDFAPVSYSEPVSVTVKEPSR